MPVAVGSVFLVVGLLGWAYYLHTAYRSPDVPGSPIGAVFTAGLGACGLHYLRETGELPWVSAWHVGIANTIWIVTAYPLGAIASVMGDRKHDDG